MELIKKLSLGQLKVLAEITGNIAVAWFTAGVISPLLVKPETIEKFVILLLVSLVMTIWFTFVSLYLVKEVRS